MFFWASFPLMQSGVCGCEKGYTEVMTTHGFLDYCTRTPGLDNNKKADVKTNSGRLKPGPSKAKDRYNEWTLRPVGPGTEMEIMCADQPVLLRPLNLTLLLTGTGEEFRSMFLHEFIIYYKKDNVQ